MRRSNWKNRTLVITISFSIMTYFAVSIDEAIAQERNTSEITQLFIAALKSNDEARVLDCTPGKEEFRKLAALEMGDSSYTDAEIDSLLEIFKMRAIENLRRLHKEGKEQKIVWNKIEVDSIIPVKRNGTNDPFPRQKIFLWISYSKHQWCIVLTDVSFITDRWRLTDKFVFKK